MAGARVTAAVPLRHQARSDHGHAFRGDCGPAHVRREALDGEILLRRQWTAREEVDRTKGGRPRIIDLTPQARTVLESWLQLRGAHDGLVFERDLGGHLSNEEARSVLYAAMERAGIPRVGEQGGKRDWHSTRHTYARLMLERSALLHLVSQQLGHSSVACMDAGRAKRMNERPQSLKGRSRSSG